MVYLSDEEVAGNLETAKSSPEAAQALQAWAETWQAQGLLLQDVNPDFVGHVFIPDPPEQLLPEDRRLLAADPNYWQLVYMTDVGMDIQTFDDETGARATLAALQPDETTHEGGGLLIQGGAVVAEHLMLRYMSKDDYIDFYERAKTPAPSVPVPDPLEAIRRTMVERLQDLTRLAPEIGELRREYEAKGLASPEVIYGRPSEALVEFQKLFPNYVTFGGCAVGGRRGIPAAGHETPPTPPPERD